MTATGWSCGHCGSRSLRFTLGDCAGCGKSLDGESQPASRSTGMYHRECWHVVASDRDPGTRTAERPHEKRTTDSQKETGPQNCDDGAA